jgi:hypothetical protein
VPLGSLGAARAQNNGRLGVYLSVKGMMLRDSCNVVPWGQVDNSHREVWPVTTVGVAEKPPLHVDSGSNTFCMGRNFRVRAQVDAIDLIMHVVQY